MLELFKEQQLDLIVHGVNCRGAAGGLAGVIFKEYPYANKLYIQAINEMFSVNLLGNMQIVSLEDGFIPIEPKQSRYIVNMFTQHEPGKEDQAVLSSTIFSCFAKLFPRCGGIKIGIPQIGAGIAGGQWSVHKALIVKAFELFGNETTEIYFIEYEGRK